MELDHTGGDGEGEDATQGPLGGISSFQGLGQEFGDSSDSGTGACLSL